MAEKAFLADPHVQIGLVAADGGPLVWPLQMSILQAKEYALTGVRITAAQGRRTRAWPTTWSPTRWPRRSRAAKKIIELPQKAVEATKRMLNIQLERQVMMTLDYANHRRGTHLRYRRVGSNNVANLRQGKVRRRSGAADLAGDIIGAGPGNPATWVKAELRTRRRLQDRARCPGSGPKARPPHRREQATHRRSPGRHAVHGAVLCTIR